MMVKLCVSVLILGHHDVLQAGGGQEALHLLQDTPADLALLDVMMPGMSGIELASHIQGKYPKTGILLMTGYGPFGGGRRFRPFRRQLGRLLGRQRI